jgi:ubiquitin-like modifier-activating enzyme ATG7
MSKIQHAPWISAIDLPFFATLGSLKIDKDRLDDSARKVLGLYQLRPDDPAENTPRMGIHDTALTTDEYGAYRPLMFSSLIAMQCPR